MKKTNTLPLIAVFILALGQFIWAQSQSDGMTRRTLRGAGISNGEETLRVLSQNLLGTQQGRPEAGRPVSGTDQHIKVMFAKRRQTTIKYGTRKPRGGFTPPANATNPGNPVFPPSKGNPIFIIDISGSMDRTYTPPGGNSTSRMDYVCSMFEESLKTMPASTKFMLYAYAVGNHPCPVGAGPPQTMVPATQANKNNATAFLRNYRAFTRSRNSPLASFQDALKLKPSVIYFLGDGSMDGQENDVLAACKAASPVPVVHSTVIGQDPGLTIPAFNAIAVATRGTFTHLK